MKHALVVGGTGMLADVSLWLVKNGYHVSIIARNPERMNHLLKKVRSNNDVTPLFVDYSNTNELQELIKYTITKNGRLDMVVAWIHSSAVDALPIIVAEASNQKPEWDLFHVLGSSSKLEKIKREIILPHTCLYYQVQLGFILEGAQSRWLTNEEISEGVIEAIKKKQNVLTVGQIEPLEQRP